MVPRREVVVDGDALDRRCWPRGATGCETRLRAGRSSSTTVADDWTRDVCPGAAWMRPAFGPLFDPARGGEVADGLRRLAWTDHHHHLWLSFPPAGPAVFALLRVCETHCRNIGAEIG